MPFFSHLVLLSYLCFWFQLIPIVFAGKVFALTASAESLTPLAAAPLYTYVYKHTITFLPGAVFYLSAALNLVTIVAVL